MSRPSPQGIKKLTKPRSEWRYVVTPEQYAVLFEEATEYPFSNSLNDEKRVGTFICVACFLPLFISEAKYDSRTARPSFTRPIQAHVGIKRDFKLIWPRLEYHCSRCGGHQGHVFNDAPLPRRQRWCNNGLALQFILAGDPLPTPRT